MPKKRVKGAKEVEFPDHIEYGHPKFVEVILPGMTTMDKFWAFAFIVGKFPIAFLSNKNKYAASKEKVDALLGAIENDLNKLDTKDLLACKYLLEAAMNGKGIFKASAKVRMQLLDRERINDLIRSIDEISSVRSDLAEITDMNQKRAFEVMQAAA